MAKKDKVAKKRAERRERAKARDTGELMDLSSEEPVDEDSRKSAVAAVAPPPQPAREKRAPKEVKEEEEDENWFVRTYKAVVGFFREVSIEARKINWPSMHEATRSTWVVVTAIVFLAAFMGAWSFVFARVAQRIFNAPKQSIAAPQMPGDNPANPVDTGGTDGTEFPD
jgi:preprotein translocase SecE subunit